MSCLWNQCSLSCPPMTVYIQPPPFMVKIPGPSMYCADRPLCIEQCNPCAPYCPPISNVCNPCAPYCPPPRNVCYPSFPKGATKCFPKPLSRFQSDCYSCQ